MLFPCYSRVIPLRKLLAVKASYPDNIACQVFEPAYYSTLGDA